MQVGSSHDLLTKRVVGWSLLSSGVPEHEAYRDAQCWPCMPDTRAHSGFRCMNVQRFPSVHLINQHWKSPPSHHGRGNASGPIYEFHGAQEETPRLSLRYARSETHLEASSFQVISDFLSNLHLFTHTSGKAKRRCRT